jgi:hypothetical protein
MSKKRVTQIEGVLLIIERGNIKGLQHWDDELERRSIPLVIQIEEYLIDKEGDAIKNLCDRGFEVVWKEFSL